MQSTSKHMVIPVKVPINITMSLLNETQLDEMRAIHRRWAESEWRLNFLRSYTAQPLTTPTNEQLRAWEQQTRQSCSPWQIPPTAN